MLLIGLFLLFSHFNSHAKILLKYELTNSRVRGWQALEREGHAVDTATRFNNRPSLKIWRNDANKGLLPEGCAWMSEPVGVVSGGTYTICAQMKVEGMATGSAGFQMNCYESLAKAKARKKTVNSVYEKIISGEDTDWTFAACTFQVPKDMRYAAIWCKSSKSFIGSAWFNAICVFEGEALPVPVVKTPPQIDGDLSDPAWDKAMKCVNFYPADPRPGST